MITFDDNIRNKDGKRDRVKKQSKKNKQTSQGDQSKLQTRILNYEVEEDLVQMISDVHQNVQDYNEHQLAQEFETFVKALSFYE